MSKLVIGITLFSTLNKCLSIFLVSSESHVYKKTKINIVTQNNKARTVFTESNNNFKVKICI